SRAISRTICSFLQSTCHTALDTCREDPSCLSSLQPMLMHCEMHRCNRNACMTSLQSFYKGPHEDLNLDVAFCLCKKTTNRHDACMIAQEKLHPICAQRPPDNNNQQSYTPPPSCHAVADACKEDRECRDGRAVVVDFDDQLIYVEPMDTTEFVVTDSTTIATTTTMTTTTQAPSK
uniref:GDNF/GAS1 domain-containing protein n=1 Tax=Glossina morsitans morsitans TaxID=37546 RepID=A0A1B0G3Z4_GLOMM